MQLLFTLLLHVVLAYIMMYMLDIVLLNGWIKITIQHTSNTCTCLNKWEKDLMTCAVLFTSEFLLGHNLDKQTQCQHFLLLQQTVQKMCIFNELFKKCVLTSYICATIIFKNFVHYWIRVIQQVNKDTQHIFPPLRRNAAPKKIDL